MKLKITLKDPDGVFQSIKQAAQDSCCDTELLGLEEDELDELAESRRKKLEEKCKPWIEHGEYVTIEIDTDAGTATVCKVKS